MTNRVPFVDDDAEDQTAEVFEEFSQLGDKARNRGSGLGLAIVARTAALLGLEIRVSVVFGDALPAILVTADTDPEVMRSLANRGIVVLHKLLDFDAALVCIHGLMKGHLRRDPGLDFRSGQISPSDR